MSNDVWNFGYIVNILWKSPSGSWNIAVRNKYKKKIKQKTMVGGDTNQRYIEETEDLQKKSGMGTQKIHTFIKKKMFQKYEGESVLCTM